MTAAIFFTMAMIATVSKRDFSSMGKFLMVGTVVLIVASLANLFFQIPGAHGGAVRDHGYDLFRLAAA